MPLKRMPVPADVELIEACLGGDERAWCALLDKYKRLIYSIPIKNGFRVEDAADIFQSVCLDLLESLPELRDSSRLGSWLITVTVRKCLHLRRHIRRQPADLEGLSSEPVLDPSSNIDQLVMEVEREQLIREAMEKLSPRCAVLLKHLFYDEPRLSYSQIAEKIGVSGNSIGATRERCLDELRSLLEEAGLT